jgi:hypothetical protein
VAEQLRSVDFIVIASMIATAPNNEEGRPRRLGIDGSDHVEASADLLHQPSIIVR